MQNIRNMRNKIMHANEIILSDADFQTMISDVENAFIALGLSVHDITLLKTKRNCYKSFKVLPPKPTHQVVYRSEKVNEIKKELQTLYINSNGKFAYFYMSGNPGSGKSQLSRQLCEDLFKGVNWEAEATFVMTLNAKDLNTLLHCYEDFCRRLNCSESILINVINSCKPNNEKIKDLRSLIESRIKNWKRWWIIVDNVEDLEDISPLLPQMGDGVWSNGQIILTTQNTTEVPSDSLFTKHISLSRGMEVQECRELLFSLSGTDANDQLLDKVAANLDSQPLAMAAAGLYFKKVIETNCCPKFSWQDYLTKLKCKRKDTEKQLHNISSAYASTMSAAVSLAVEKSADNSLILNYTFNLFSLISFESLPVDIIVKYIHQIDQDCEKEEICLALKNCSLLLTENQDVRLHRVVHEAIKLFSDFNKTETKDYSQSRISNKRRKVDVASRPQNVVRAFHHFKDRQDKIKMIPHLKAFTREVKNLFPEKDSLYSISLGFEKVKICQIYLLFGHTLYSYSEFKLAVEFHNTNLQICKDSENRNYRVPILSELGKSYTKMGDLDQAKDYHQRALTIQEKQLGPNHVDVASSCNNIGNVYQRKGDLDQAKDYYHRALAIQEKQLGPNYLDVASSYNNIGNVCV